MSALFDPEIRVRNNLTDDEWRGLSQSVLLIENIDTDDMFLKTARKVAQLAGGKILARDVLTADTSPHRK